MSTATSKPAVYAVMWSGELRGPFKRIDGPPNRSFHAIAWEADRNPQVRTYEVGNLDPRWGKEEKMVRLEDELEASAWMWANPGVMCLVNADAVRGLLDVPVAS